LLAPEIAAGIIRVKGPRRQGVRIGKWLTQEQAENLLSQPSAARIKGLRDSAILALMVGCGLRRGEVATRCPVFAGPVRHHRSYTAELQFHIRRT